MTKKMRTFGKDTAIRHDDVGKLDYEGFLNPLVLEAFAKYMHKNRIQADGKIRASDNWQKLFGKDHYEVCAKSNLRHVHSFWKAHRGYKTEESIMDSLMGQMFNVQAYALKLLQEDEPRKAKWETVADFKGGVSVDKILKRIK